MFVQHTLSPEQAPVATDLVDLHPYFLLPGTGSHRSLLRWYGLRLKTEVSLQKPPIKIEGFSTQIIAFEFIRRREKESDRDNAKNRRFGMGCKP